VLLQHIFNGDGNVLLPLFLFLGQFGSQDELGVEELVGRLTILAIPVMHLQRVKLVGHFLGQVAPGNVALHDQKREVVKPHLLFDNGLHAIIIRVRAVSAVGYFGVLVGGLDTNVRVVELFSDLRVAGITVLEYLFLNRNGLRNDLLGTLRHSLLFVVLFDIKTPNSFLTSLVGPLTVH
jgi:hypothetical protein